MATPHFGRPRYNIASWCRFQTLITVPAVDCAIIAADAALHGCATKHAFEGGSLTVHSFNCMHACTSIQASISVQNLDPESQLYWGSSVVWLCGAVLKSGINMAFDFWAVACTKPPILQTLHPIKVTAALHVGWV